MRIIAISPRSEHFRDSPNLGDGNISALLLADYLLYFRDNPNLGDGSFSSISGSIRFLNISEITPNKGTETYLLSGI